MRRGTTPTHTITTDIDLTGAAAVYVTYAQKGCTVVEKSAEDITIGSDYVEIALTQAETLAFSEGRIEVQIRARFPDGSAVASNVMQTTVAEILKDGEI